MGPLSVGVDLGQKRDYTAIVVTELERGAFTGRLVQRLPLGTPYPLVAKRVCEVVENLGKKRPEAWPRLLIDSTGVGAPVVELIEADVRGRCELMPCTFTHGDQLLKPGEDRKEWRVGKAYLVSRLQVLFQTDRIKLPRTADTEALKTELLAYEIKIDPDANDKYGAFAVGTHDDLVTALGLAALMDWPEGSAEAAVIEDWMMQGQRIIGGGDY